MQDTYTRILKVRENAEVRSGKALLFAVARNAVRDLIRRRSVARLESVTEVTDSPVLQDETDVVEFVSRQQELALLQEAFHALPPRCREVLLLRKITGLSQREIAARLGITENTVETLVAKGVRRCRDYLRGLGLDGSSSP
jgi:RNA polymerase sigma-70 factor (ECF subfamily)